MKDARKLLRALEYIFFGKQKKETNDRPVRNYVGDGKYFKRFLGTNAFSKQQRCIVKFWNGFSMKKHLNFVKRYMPQLDKDEVIEKPKLFNNSNDEDIVEKYKEKMSRKFFKIIVSPESQNVNIKALAITLMARLEFATGYKFRWLCVEHRNTDHPHAHILIDGTSKDGREIKISNSFKTKIIRNMAREVCTIMVGERSNEMVQMEAKKIPELNRLTRLDNIISSLSKPLSNVNESYESTVITENEVLRLRVKHLCDIGLAVRGGDKDKYYLEKDWYQKLKEMSSNTSYLKARNELKGIKRPLIFWDKKTPVSGKIVKVYQMNFEAAWDNAVVVQDDAGNLIFVPLHYSMDRKNTGKQIRVTKTIQNKTSVKILSLSK